MPSSARNNVIMERWTRDQTIVTLNLYYRIPFNKASNNNPEIIKVAELIGRSINSVKMKVGNFGSFDSKLKAQGIVGLSSTSKLDKEIWDEYHNNLDRLAYDSATIISKLSKRPIEDVINPLVHNSSRETERAITIKQRINQSFFRDAVLSAYDYRCCITGLSCTELLEACHIVDWATDERNRINPQNGLCMDTFFHRAYDKHYIGITPDYKIKISDRLINAYNSQNLIIKFLLSIDDNQITLPSRFLPDKNLLDIHYQEYSKR